jgi:A/G-specific adenine glycosylase
MSKKPGPAKQTHGTATAVEMPPPKAAVDSPPALEGESIGEFRHRLGTWYREHARVLPWREIHDPYATWLSEIMLQQTQVATVQQRYVDFLHRFPTLQSLAAAEEDDVLANWSGLGYYRRARMLHKAARFVVDELGGQLPGSSAELRTLPGVGEYTAAAIASIAFGESIAVVDGNVERVLLRVTGHPEDKTAAGRSRVARTAQALVPPKTKTRGKSSQNAPGDHNQAMMELGATICVPRGPLCLQCPVFDLCHTRGEHLIGKREKQQNRRVAYLLALRQKGSRTEVLLEQRPQEASLMPGMFELPPLPLDAVEGHAPVLRVRHAITNTNYAVEVFPHSTDATNGNGAGLIRDIPSSTDDLHWASIQQLSMLPLTGLARKCLIKMKLMEVR